MPLTQANVPFFVIYYMLCPRTWRVWYFSGDSDVALDSIFDKTRRPSSSSRHYPKIWSKWAKMLHYHNLIDVWREHNPSRKNYTLFSKVHRTYSRIDHFFTNSEGVPLLRASKIVNVTWSDHSLLWTLCDTLAVNKGAASWRLNESLLSNPSVCFDIERNLKVYFESNKPEDTSPVINWEAHKATIRCYPIQVASHLKKNLNALVHKKKKLSDLLTRHKQNPNVDIRDKIDSIRMELNLCPTTKAKK